MSPLQEQDSENMEDSTQDGEARWSKLALDANQPIEDGVDYLHFFQGEVIKQIHVTSR